MKWEETENVCVQKKRIREVGGKKDGGKWGREGEGTGGRVVVGRTPCHHTTFCGLTGCLCPWTSWRAAWVIPAIRGCTKTAGRWCVWLTCLADWVWFILNKRKLRVLYDIYRTCSSVRFCFAFLAWWRWNKTLLKRLRYFRRNSLRDLRALTECFRFLSKSSLLSGKKQSRYLYRPRTSWLDKVYGSHKYMGD